MNPILTLQGPDKSWTFVFTDEEVPEHIAHGGSQAMSIDRLIGGRKIVRPLGPDEEDISFSGLFAYQGTARSDFLDSVRRRGELCRLSWDNRSMLVVVASYHPDYFKAYQIGYSITFKVVRNEASFVDLVPIVTPIEQLNADSQHLNDMAACSFSFGNSALAGLSASISSGLKTVETAAQPIAKGLRSIGSKIGFGSAGTGYTSTAISSVSTAIGGVVTVIQSISTGIKDAANCAAAIGNQVTQTASAVAAPVAQLLASTQALITNSETSISNAVSFGGVIPGNPLALTVGKYMTQVNTAVQIPALYETQSVAQRMIKNLALASGSSTSKTITVAGGTLYDVAAQQYGDGTQWVKIAAANHMTDPNIVGIKTLVIPA